MIFSICWVVFGGSRFPKKWSNNCRRWRWFVPDDVTELVGKSQCRMSRLGCAGSIWIRDRWDFDTELAGSNWSTIKTVHDWLVKWRNTNWSWCPRTDEFWVPLGLEFKIGQLKRCRGILFLYYHHLPSHFVGYLILTQAHFFHQTWAIRKRARRVIGFQNLCEHQASDGTFTNSDNSFEGYVIPVHITVL